MTSHEVIEALRGKYAPPSWAFLEQVGNGTGARCSRHADAIAMNLWPSRGLEIIGFEVKVSRSDWLSELKHPAKAEEMSRHCDSWFVVVPERSMVQSSELPKGWGLIVSTGDKCKIEIEPIRREAIVDRSFMAAILRRTQEQLTDAAKLEAVRRAGYWDGEKQGIELGKMEGRIALSRHKQLMEKVMQFEEASGVNIANSWSGDKIGEAVRAVMKGGMAQAIRQVEQLRDSSAHTLKRLEEDLQALKSATQ